MDRELEYLVSNYDIENQFDHSKNIKILLYSDLNDINELTDLVPFTSSACFILLKTSENSGHWICIARDENMIYYFDSYGVKPDGELSRISSGARYMLHENQKALTRLIRTIPKNMNFEYNKTRFQKYSPSINTCGKWTTIFSKCVLQGMTLKEFT
eukprot:gene18552-21693_t